MSKLSDQSTQDQVPSGVPGSASPEPFQAMDVRQDSRVEKREPATKNDK
jgi:hypothetical protein